MHLLESDFHRSIQHNWNSVEIKRLKGPLCTTDTSIKTADSKQRENHWNAITSITLLTQDVTLLEL
jgi:hypothetical protein